MTLSVDPSDLEHENAALRERLVEVEAALAAKTAALAAKTAEAEANAAMAEANAAKAEANAAKAERLQQSLDALARQIFGRSSERVDPRQLQLAFEEAVAAGETPPPFVSEAPDEETPSADDDPKNRKKKRKKRNGRVPLPAHLPRERKLHNPDPEELVCECCGGEKTAFGEEVTSQLEHRPASFVVIEHVRKKFSCKKCHSSVTIAPLPAFPIDRGRPGPGLLAEVIVRKYGDHTPLNRLSGIFAREGVIIPKQTLGDWIRAAAGRKLLKPIYDEIRRSVFASPVIQADETGIRVLRHSIPGRPRAHKRQEIALQAVAHEHVWIGREHRLQQRSGFLAEGQIAEAGFIEGGDGAGAGGGHRLAPLIGGGGVDHGTGFS